MKPDKDAKFKVCLQCGDKILATIDKEICDECDVPYITEEDIAKKKVADEKVAKAEANYKETVAKAKAEIDEAKAKLDKI